MRLDQYLTEHSIRVMQYGTGDCLLVFADDLPKEGKAKARMWSLSDYVVSAAVSGPGYVLSPRGGIVTDTFPAPAQWASYLINGDASGLEDYEIRQADAWLSSIAPWQVISAEGEAYFSHSVRLHAPQVTYSSGDLLDYSAVRPAR